LEGDFKAHIDLKNPLKSSALGELKGKGIIFPWRPEAPVKIDDFAVNATTEKIHLKSADLTIRGNRLQVAGNTTVSSKEVLFDMDITADTVDLDPLIQVLKKKKNENKGGNTSPSLPVRGSVRFKADRFKIGEFNWSPLEAHINLDADSADVRLKKADICGVSTPGTLKVSPQFLEFDIETLAKDQELESTLSCFGSEDFKIDGKYNLKGKFQGGGKAETLLNTTRGDLDFVVADGGHIYHDIFLLNLFKFLNTIAFLPGQVKTKAMGEKGFDYHSFRMKVKMQGGKLLFEEMILDGAPMILTGAGQQDLRDGRFDLAMLVTPLTTLGRLFDYVPLVGGILKAADTIPVGVKGTLDNMEFFPLAPSAVGYNLKEMMKNTFKGPLNLMHAGKKSRKKK
jgi:hypothetical protein